MIANTTHLVDAQTVEPLTSFAVETVELFNLNAIFRTAMRQNGRTNRWLAAVLGQSEQLTQAQLADDHPEKHLSLRKAGRIGRADRQFWKTFFLLALEDLGFVVVVMDKAQAEAFYQLQAASARFTQEITR